jgi:hypothetical protein
MPCRTATQNKEVKSMTPITKNEKLTIWQKIFAREVTISGECGGRELSPRVNQCNTAVRPAATISASTITVVVSENLRSVLINFSPFNHLTKSELAHFYTVYVKNLPGFKLISTFALPLFIKIGQNSTLNLLAYRPLTPS